MSWDDRRTVRGVATIARHAAHSDDAKHRTDESTKLVPRARWVAPVAVVGALLLLGGVTAAAVVVARGHVAPQRASAPGAASREKHSSGASSSVRSADPVPTPGTYVLTGTAHRVTVAFRKSRATDTTQGGVTATFDCTSSACVETKASYFAVDRAGVRLARTSNGDYTGKRSEGDAFLHVTLTFHLVITSQAGVLTVSSPSVLGGQENGSSEALPAITTTLTGTWTRS